MYIYNSIGPRIIYMTLIKEGPRIDKIYIFNTFLSRFSLRKGENDGFGHVKIAKMGRKCVIPKSKSRQKGVLKTPLKKCSHEGGVVKALFWRLNDMEYTTHSGFEICQNHEWVRISALF